MSLSTLWITPLAGFVLGIALVRANSCSVAATVRLVDERRADWLVGILIAVGWAGLVLLGFAFVAPMTLSFPADLPITWSVIGGGILLGLGGLLNKGCFLGSVSYLCRGNLNYLLTLAGISIALLVFNVAPDGFTPVRPRSATEVIVAVEFGWPYRLAALLFGVMAIVSFVKLFRRRRITIIALIIVGLTGGVIYAFNPDWSYTSVLNRALHGQLTAQNWILETGALSMFAGAILSSILGSTFTIAPISYRRGLSCFAGGFLMGGGAKMVPGGNDALMLWSLPGLTLHGLVAYTIMVITIAVGFALMARLMPDMLRSPSRET